MLAKINITNTDINYAENILLSKGHHFDKERRIFIKNLDTIDLQAVPGSGKTTALLAKLLILEKKMPFKNGAGILVISHTNAAIDEIKEKIGIHCPKLFSYPSYVGTIQGFVDEFLAKPYYQNKYKKKIYVIDNEIYNKKASKYNTQFLKNFSRQEQNNAKRFLRSNDYYAKVRTSKKGDHFYLTNGLNGTEITCNKPKGNTKPENYQNWSREERVKVYKWIYKWRERIIKDGILNFDDAYSLGEEYLYKFPLIKSLVQKRFCYTFVDEMQDMDRHQYDILEKIFFAEGNSITMYQRVGDQNQGIFSGDVKTEVVWAERKNTLQISGSHRLAKSTAAVIEPFSILSGYPLRGRNNSSKNLKPHLLVYGINETECSVIQKYVKLVKDFQVDGLIPTDKDTIRAKPISVISWVTIPKGNSKTTLPKFCPNYKKDKVKSRQEYSCLSDYLKFYDKKKHGIKPIRENIINAILKGLRLSKIRDKNDRYYNTRSFIKLFKEELTEEHALLKSNLYQWSISIARCKHDVAYKSIKVFIPEFIEKMGSKITPELIEFLSDKTTTDVIEHDKKDSCEYPCDKCMINEEKILIGSVHSVKGQTHTATLYLESFYNGDYESVVLPSVFSSEKTIDIIDRCNSEIKILTKEIENIRAEGKERGIKRRNNDIAKKKNHIDKIKKNSKMMYVGFSRPTHFLCFAIHKDRFKQLSNSVHDNWEVIAMN